MWMSPILTMFPCKYFCCSHQRGLCWELGQGCSNTSTFYGSGFKEKQHLCASKRWIIEKILPIPKCFLPMESQGSLCCCWRPENSQSLIFHFQKEAEAVSALRKLFLFLIFFLRWKWDCWAWAWKCSPLETPVPPHGCRCLFNFTSGNAAIANSFERHLCS